MADERCETCRFWRVRELIVTLDGEPTGDTMADPECRRHAPRYFVTEDWSGSSWPSVKADDWCGEYQSTQPVIEE